MRLNVKALALALGIVWGLLGMALVGVLHLTSSGGYGQQFLDLMASIYPGYHARPELGQVLIGTLYGIVDGAIAGAIFAWVYNLCAGRAAT